ncbi:MAG: GNAT family N-acetyltransferase [Dehalococcoidia bacterium]|nr:GNAT family N-acetyltransferase [Dehalococcoidia bacterium]MDD5647488.1 GNAT family N-acetyltransferase [Dehalococcoidia bacterium]
MSTNGADGQRGKDEKPFPVPLPDQEENGGRKKIDIEIREMGVDDIPEVFHLGEQVFTADKTPTLYRTWDEFEVISMFNEDTEYCLVAALGWQIVGFALGNVVTKKKSAWKYGYLVWLVVSPEYQRMGVASRLFNKFEDKMIEAGVRIFMIDTEADNLPALHFFRAKGFGNPQQHIYMTYNPAATELQKEKKRSLRGKRNGTEHRRSG